MTDWSDVNEISRITGMCAICHEKINGLSPYPTTFAAGLCDECSRLHLLPVDEDGKPGWWHRRFEARDERP